MLALTSNCRIGELWDLLWMWGFCSFGPGGQYDRTRIRTPGFCCSDRVLVAQYLVNVPGPSQYTVTLDCLPAWILLIPILLFNLILIILLPSACYLSSLVVSFSFPVVSFRKTLKSFHRNQVLNVIKRIFLVEPSCLSNFLNSLPSLSVYPQVVHEL